MIQIRNSMFETNSSSCHVFVYDPKVEVNIPNTVVLVPKSEDTMIDILFNDHYAYYGYYHTNEPREFGIEYVTEFLNNLLALGVQNVKCSDQSIVDLFEKTKTEGNYYCYNKKALAHVLFDKTTQCTELEDYEVSQKAIDEKFGKGFKYYSIRLT